MRNAGRHLSFGLALLRTHGQCGLPVTLARIVRTINVKQAM
jgi:hypothetical protein